MTAGVIVLDKPAGVTSAHAVDLVKQRLGAERAGHGGTLDPLATGVLPICLEEATKLAPYLLADDKAYEAELVLGVETDTLDRTGQVIATHDASAVTRAAMEAVLGAHVGPQQQVPPMYSAIKQGGVRLHERARAGIEVERAPRAIRIDRLELLAWTPPRAIIAITCGKGTYVRSLVADLGRALGCGAHLAELRRTRSGVFGIDQACALDDLGRATLIGMIAATRLPIVAMPAGLERKIHDGVQTIAGELAGLPPDGERFQLVAAGDRLVAIARIERGKILYDRVFANVLSRAARSS
ncbi:MAG TPA: tRNA pseudouridine(55) synthase TruB [Kofleriaceae bacterium]